MSAQHLGEDYGDHCALKDVGHFMVDTFAKMVSSDVEQ